MQNITTALRSLLLYTLFLGGIYPLAITLIGSVLSPIRSHGSLLKKGDVVVGSELIGQKFTQDRYFWGRPSTADYVPLSSGASQRSATDRKLMHDFRERSQKLPGSPPDLLWASASGLDPHISLAAARYQIQRISQTRNMKPENIDKILRQVSEDRFLGFMGQPRVNVLELNLLLDKQEN